MPMTIQDLLASRAPVTALSDEAVDVAVARMNEHDFSQLPVVDGHSRPLGLISRESILRAVMEFEVGVAALKVGDAFDSRVPRFDIALDDENESEVLEALKSNPAALVVEHKGASNETLQGIVTIWDAADAEHV